MPRKSSPTKRSPSNSRAKKVAKPRVKKVLVENEVKSDWNIYWLRTMNGEEYIGDGTVLQDGVLLANPVMLTYLQGNVVLAPYGIMAQKTADVRPFFFPQHACMHVNEVNEQIKEFYRVSIRTSLDYVETHFGKLVEKSQAMVEEDLKAAFAEREREPTDEELDQIEAEIEGYTKPKLSSKKDAIDNLVKLAEAQGKGKNKVD